MENIINFIFIKSLIFKFLLKMLNPLIRIKYDANIDYIIVEHKTIIRFGNLNGYDPSVVFLYLPSYNKHYEFMTEKISDGNFSHQVTITISNKDIKYINLEKDDIGYIFFQSKTNHFRQKIVILPNLINSVSYLNYKIFISFSNLCNSITL